MFNPLSLFFHPKPTHISDGTFETEVKKLINEDDETGPVITNPYVGNLAENSIQFKYANPDALQRLLDRGDSWMMRQLVKNKTEDELQEIALNWMLLASLIFDEKERFA